MNRYNLVLARASLQEVLLSIQSITWEDKYSEKYNLEELELYLKDLNYYLAMLYNNEGSLGKLVKDLTSLINTDRHNVKALTYRLTLIVNALGGK